MANLFKVFLTVMISSTVFAQKYQKVECDFEYNECAWVQGTNDLSDWKRITEPDGQNSYMSSIGSKETLARMYSGNFSYPDSPSISLRYYIHGNLTDKYITNIKFYSLGQDGELRLLDQITYDGNDDWKTYQFTVFRGEDVEKSEGPLIIEADIKAAGQEVAIDNIIVFGCRITPGSTNSAVDPSSNGLSCLSVPEASKDGSTTCSFRTSGVASIEFIGGDLPDYNDLELVDYNTYMNIIMTDPYTPIIDTANPNVVPEGNMTCIDSTSTNGSIVTYTLIIKIFEENTQPPKFEQNSYEYIGVPESQPIGADFTILDFGPPIVASDGDNSEENTVDSSNIIVFQFEDDFGTFLVNSSLKDENYPRKYSAAISLLKPLNYATNSSYTLKLRAENADGNQGYTSTVTVTVNVAPPSKDNVNFSFATTNYAAVITEEMLRYGDTYIVPTNHLIDIEDDGMNIPVSYAINYNCGETEECQILRENFRIDAEAGFLFFTNYIGNWNHLIPQITFEISASQDGFPHRTAQASVTAFFELP